MVTEFKCEIDDALYFPSLRIMHLGISDAQVHPANEKKEFLAICLVLMSLRSNFTFNLCSILIHLFEECLIQMTTMQSSDFGSWLGSNFNKIIFMAKIEIIKKEVKLQKYMYIASSNVHTTL